MSEYHLFPAGSVPVPGGRGISRFSPVEVGAASHRVVREMLLTLLVAEVLQGVGPQQVAHGPVRRRLFESV